jgi:hypothetical protein
MKVQFPNGMVVEGTEQQIRDTANALGFRNVVDDGVHYNSSTKGYILISDMDSRHIKNVILKMYREWLSTLSSTMTDAEFASTIKRGIFFNNATFTGLVRELDHR